MVSKFASVIIAILMALSLNSCSGCQEQIIEDEILSEGRNKHPNVVGTLFVDVPKMFAQSVLKSTDKYYTEKLRIQVKLKYERLSIYSQGNFTGYADYVNKSFTDVGNIREHTYKLGLSTFNYCANSKTFRYELDLCLSDLIQYAKTSLGASFE
jgi:hypothetical protein